VKAPPRVYVAGPYSAPSLGARKKNVRRAVKAARLIVDFGGHPAVPHLVGFECEDAQPSWEWWMAATSRELSTCDACVVVEDYEGSRGTELEIAQCRRERRPVFFLSKLEDVSRLISFLTGKREHDERQTSFSGEGW
jgi:hypothetical protein